MELGFKFGWVRDGWYDADGTKALLGTIKDEVASRRADMEAAVMVELGLLVDGISRRRRRLVLGLLVMF